MPIFFSGKWGPSFWSFHDGKFTLEYYLFLCRARLAVSYGISFCINVRNNSLADLYFPPSRRWQGGMARWGGGAMCSVGQMGTIVSPVPATQPPPSPLSNTTQFLSCVCDEFMLILLS